MESNFPRMSPWMSSLTQSLGTYLTGVLWGLKAINEVMHSVNISFRCYMSNKGFGGIYRIRNCGQGKARANPRAYKVTESYYHGI